MDADAQLDNVQPGTPVVTANGEPLGAIRAAFPHYLLVADEATQTDYDVPRHALDRVDDGRLYLRINREALTPIADDSTERRLGPDQEH
jgi:hypothetical protein